jgi:hypothetical protein
MEQKNACWAAATWVLENKGMIYKRIFMYKKLLYENDDYIQDAIIIATEAMAKSKRKNVAFEAIFWVKFKGLLWRDCQMAKKEVLVDGEDGFNTDEIAVEDPVGEYLDRQKMIEGGLTFFYNNCLSPSERKVARLMGDIGENSTGLHSLSETEEATGYSHGAVCTLFGRAKKKALHLSHRLTHDYSLPYSMTRVREATI